MKPIDENLKNGIFCSDENAEFVNNIKEADIAVLQQGWTVSKVAVSEYKIAKENGIPCNEGYLYTDKYEVHTN